MRIQRTLILLLLLPWMAGLGAQDTSLSNLRQQRVAVILPGQLLDTLTVVPESFELGAVAGAGAIAESSYELAGRYLKWLADPGVDSVTVRYRVLPFRLDERVALLDSTDLEREDGGLVIGGYDDYIRSGIFDNDGKVRTSGSFSRGISFGNSQSLVLNSAFNLQLNGELGNGIEVAAAITDENLPVQPEGTTQQLREFDRVFIQLRKGGSQLTAGDYELRNPDGHFLRYYKKLEGATFTTGSERWQNAASVALTRGQFIRQNIQPTEGNQGPYRLTGGGNQRFLIVLAGTERVFVNNVLQVRGLDGDYVIDYNLAEVTFTPRRLITRDSRITVEYEYADQRYVRTLAASSTRYRTERFGAYLNLYTQQDSRTATGDQELTAAQREAVGRAGATPNGVPVSSIEALEGRAELRVTYERRDTVLTCNGAPLDTAYLSASPGGGFVATFTDRGPTGGTYALDPTRPANERVYVFVGRDPATCRPRGRFEPVIDLLPPQQQRMAALGASFRPNERGNVSVEASLTQLDANRFNETGAAVTTGNALRADVDQLFELGDSSGWQLGLRAALETVDADFRPINPFRDPDFYRSWNLSDRLSLERPAPAAERLLAGGIDLIRPGTLRLTYGRETFNRANDYTGDRQLAALNLTAGDWTIDANYDALASQDSLVDGSLRRPRIAIAKVFDALGGWRLAAGYEGEESLRRFTARDSLTATSFGFGAYKFALTAPLNDRYALRLTANRREDRLPLLNELRTSTRATELSTEGNYVAGKNLTLGGTLTYRDLDVVRPDLVNDDAQRTFLGRLDVRASGLGQSLRSQTTYQVGSGQEPRVEFQYLFVGAGQGQYIWQDSLYNNNGRIEPNEMERAPFADIGDYVRVSVATNDFIRTDNAALNQTLNWNPARIWRSETGPRRALAKFSFTNGLRVDRKTRRSDDVTAWNPLQLAVADSSLVSLNLSRRHGLFFNRANPVYDVQLSNNDRWTRRVLTTGYEEARQRDWTLQFRFRPGGDQLSIEASATAGSRAADSEFFNNKDFDFERWSLEPTVDWQPENFRLAASLVLATETNVLPDGDGEGTNRREFRLEGNWRRWFVTSFRWIDIKLDGSASSPLGFALLQGLQPGRNLLWNAGATRNLGEYLQLTLSYEGRRTGEARTVHVGRAEVTALF